VEGTEMAEIYEISEIRQRQIRVSKLRQMFKERFDCVVIPPPGMVLKDVVYIFPLSYMRHIDDLTLSEMDDLLNCQLEFFIMR
jgi:hypothetical protein